MSYSPTRYDVAADLEHAIYASFSGEKFKDGNVIMFLSHAFKDLSKVKNQMNKRRFALAQQMIRNALKSNRAVTKRREDLLMASILIRS